LAVGALFVLLPYARFCASSQRLRAWLPAFSVHVT
jgi:hypothetical protein